MSDLLTIEHCGDKCDVVVEAERGSRSVRLYNRRTGVTLLTLRIVSNEGSWLAAALAEATDYARDSA